MPLDPPPAPDRAAEPDAGWAVGRAIAAPWFAGTTSAFGLAHPALEGAFVGALAAAEWTQRELLVTAA